MEGLELGLHRLQETPFGSQGHISTPFPTALASERPAKRHHVPFLCLAAGGLCGGVFKGMVKCPGWSFKRPTNADSTLGTRRSPSLQAPAGGTSAFPSREQKNEKRPSHNPASQPKFLVFEGLMKGSQGGSGCSWRQQATGRGRSRFAFSQGAPRQPAGPLLCTRPAGRAVAERRTCLCRRSCGLICVEQWGSLGD